jgi:thiosulfate/3-mercaptopyruvate sulfurtransferase
MSRDAIFVSTGWLAANLDNPDVVVLDGSYYLSTMNRNAQAEFLAGHVPGAIRFDIDAVKDERNPLPHMLPTADVFAAKVGAMGISDAMTIIIYDGMGFFSAPRVRWTFRSFGATDVRILEGGYPKWMAEGRPVETGEQQPRKPASFKAIFDPSAVATMADIKAALASKAAQVVDMRSAGRFNGSEAEPRPNLPSGHMPGSLNLPSAMLVENGHLKDEAALTAIIAAAGVDLDKSVIASCGSGVSAVILSTAMELLGKPAKAIYDGSWTEWASQPGAQIAKG